MKPAVTTISLLVANVLVLGYILLVDRNRPDTDTGATLAGHLFYLEPDEVQKLVIRTSEGEAVVERRPDLSWAFSAPFVDRFSPELMSLVLKDAARVPIDDTIAEKEIKSNGWNDEYFGFGENSVHVEFLNAEGETLGAGELGGPSPYKDRIYARRTGDDGGTDGAVVLVSDYLLGDLSAPFQELRDPRLIFAKTSDVYRAKFLPPSPTTNQLEIRVQRGPENVWVMDRPLEARCDQELVNEIVGQLTKLEVAEIVDEPDADAAAAFEKPGSYEIVLLQDTPAETNKKVRIEFGKLPADKEDPYVLARVSGRDGYFLMDKSVHRQFDMDTNSLRARTLANFDYRFVSGVNIERVNRPKITLRKWHEVWAIHPDDNDPERMEAANGRMVKDLIDMINDHEILKFSNDSAIDLEPYGLKDPPLRLTIFRQIPNPEKPEEVIQVKDTLLVGVGNAEQSVGNTFAAFEGESFVYKISESLPRQLGRDDARDYRSLQLWPRFSAFDLRKITLADDSGKPPLELQFDYKLNAWTAIRGGEDVTESLDRVMLDGYLQYLGRPPRGKDWTDRTGRSAQALANNPSLKLTIDLIDPQDKKTPRTITFSAAPTNASKQYFYGKINEVRDDVFLEEQTIRKMSMPLIRLDRANR